VSFTPPECSPTTDLARFGSAVQRLSRAASRFDKGSAVLVPTADRGDLSRALGRFAQLISHRVPLLKSERAFDLVLPPGAAEKVIVTLDD
jgi:hypothetical protein